MFVLTVESDWNPITLEEAGKTMEAITAYRASKKFAEKAAWDFMNTETPGFDLITILPPMVFGPSVYNLSSTDHLNESNKQLYRVVSAGRNASVPPTLMWQFVDVRDTAAAHVSALNPHVAGNRRILLGGGEFSWQKVILRTKTFTEADRGHCKTEV